MYKVLQISKTLSDKGAKDLIRYITKDTVTRKNDNSKLGKDVEQLEYSNLDGKSTNWYNHLGKLQQHLWKPSIWTG